MSFDTISYEMTVRIVRETRSPSELAAELGVSVNTVRRWVRDGQIDAVLTPGGRISGIPLDAIRELRRPARASGQARDRARNDGQPR